MHVGIVVDEVQWDGVSSEYFCYHCKYHLCSLHVLQRMGNWPIRGCSSTGTLPNPITRINFLCTKIILKHRWPEDSMCAGMNTKDARLSTRRIIDCDLTLRLLMSYIYGAPSKARNANVVYIWTYVWQSWNSLFLLAAQCFNTESMQRGFLCHICV